MKIQWSASGLNPGVNRWGLTWSLRERPVCSFPPTDPMCSVRRLSLAVWMSSSPDTILKVPDSHSCSTFFSPSTICRASSSVMMPVLASALAYA